MYNPTPILLQSLSHGGDGGHHERTQYIWSPWTLPIGSIYIRLHRTFGNKQRCRCTPQPHEPMQHSATSLGDTLLAINIKHNTAPKGPGIGRGHKRRRVVVQHQYFLYSQPPNSCLTSSPPNKSMSCSQKQYRDVN